MSISCRRFPSRFGTKLPPFFFKVPIKTTDFLIPKNKIKHTYIPVVFVFDHQPCLLFLCYYCRIFVLKSVSVSQLVLFFYPVLIWGFGGYLVRGWWWWMGRGRRRRGVFTLCVYILVGRFLVTCNRDTDQEGGGWW